MEKLIGIFTEIDGIECENLSTLIDRFGIIGSLSGDVGSIELYYDNKGTTYAVAHGSEAYYGSYKDRNYRFLNTETNEFSHHTKIDNMFMMLVSNYCECKDSKHNILDKKDNNFKCKNCMLLNNIDTLGYDYKISIIKDNGYTVLEEK